MEASNKTFSVFSKLNKGDRLEAINVLIGALNHSEELDIVIKLIDESIGDGEKSMSENGVQTENCPNRNSSKRELSKKSMSENAIKTEICSNSSSSRRFAHFQLKWSKESESPIDANGEKMSNYIAKNDNNSLLAVCTACHVNIYIGYMGASAIFQHSDSIKHRRCRERDRGLSIMEPLSDSNSLRSEKNANGVKKTVLKRKCLNKIEVEKGNVNGRYLSKFQRDWIFEDLSPVDLNGEKFSSYIAQDEDDKKAYCLTCEAKIDITNLGAAAIHQHSKTVKHCKKRGLNNSNETEIKALGNVGSNICSENLSVDDKKEILRHVKTIKLKSKAKSKKSVRRVCKFKSKWLLENSPLDSNGEKFSSYIVKCDDSKAFCIRCNAIIDITNQGAAAISQHAKSKKHSYSKVEMV